MNCHCSLCSVELNFFGSIILDSLINFDNSYSRLPSDFYSPSSADLPPKPKIVIYNHDLSEQLNLPKMNEVEICNYFSGAKKPKQSTPLAMAYAGHQFGHYSPLLGDGRALLLGEVISKKNIRFDISLKGSGPTKYSRRGDGKTALGPALREYIVSEAMYHLGVPTTRALAVTTTGETIYREQPLPGAVITRVSESFIRVGTFEYFARQKDNHNLNVLLNYKINRHYPELKKSSNPAFDFFKTVLNLQAKLTAHWMSLGFIHGVMNTDNSSTAGLTIDYGPCAFMDYYKHDQVYSYIDQRGRYNYSNQVPITLWNLTRLAECLLKTYDHPEQQIKNYEEALSQFENIFNQFWAQKMSIKLGLIQENEANTELAKAFLQYLEMNSLDFTNSFRGLTQYLKNENNQTPEHPFFINWIKQVKTQNLPMNIIINKMNQVNPAYIPRNHLIEQLIQEANNNNYKSFYEFNKILSSPYETQQVHNKYRLPPEPDQIVTATFCGT